MYKRLLQSGVTPQTRELKESIMGSLLRDAGKPEVEATLTELAAVDPSQLDQIARGLARRPTAANWPLLVRGLQSNNPEALLDIIRALRRLPTKAVVSKEPKPEEATPYRLLLLASAKLPPQERLKAVELLRHWKDQKFAVEPSDWKGELEGWSHWFVQTFPKEPSLPNVTEIAVQSKWKFAELLPYLESAQGRGDAARQVDLREGKLHQVPQIRQHRRRPRPRPDHAEEPLQAGRHSGIADLSVQGDQ